MKCHNKRGRGADRALSANRGFTIGHSEDFGDTHPLQSLSIGLNVRNDCWLIRTIKEVIQHAWDAESILFGVEGKKVVVKFWPATDADRLIERTLPVMLAEADKDYHWLYEYRNNSEEENVLV